MAPTYAVPGLLTRTFVSLRLFQNGKTNKNIDAFEATK